ncbi:MAG TPA: SRPBCC domain-containing protein [Pirellulaceae bacterium]|nr:SRPBCC domain-containing protein [Pirellulaceae bacterium]
MKIYDVTITIDARAEVIWEVLADLPEYPAWEPNIEKVEGRIASGEKIKLFTKLSPGRAFPVKVSDVEPPTKMTWTGGMPLGLFKGVRTFTLSPSEAGMEFRMREVFSGLMAPLILRSMPDLTESFEAFATALKARAESRARGG